MRHGLETGGRDPLAASLAEAVDALVHAGQRAVDGIDGGPGGRREGEVALALDVDRVALARLLVELGVARLPIDGQSLGLGG